ncbi:MAG TPA: DUF3617 family protein [Thermoanaerobaculia bacterium]|nr:DUF3617 family protein [Thermoanaerobaculia bacterium]
MTSVIAVWTARAAFAQSNAPAALTPGLWEITVQTQLPTPAAPMSHTVCIDKLHVAKPNPPRSRPSDDCQVTADAASANETAYTVHCGKRNVTSTSRFTYSGSHFEGVMIITGPDSEIRQVYSAKRLGPCDDEQPVNPGAAQ